MPEILIDVLQATAWPMTPPKPYSSFHLLLTAAGLSFAFLSARFLGRRGNGCQKKAIRILFACGMLLALMEAYKQCFLYYLNGFRYNWWYFPFQLCSTPMYLCLLLPLAKKESTRTILASFLQDFGILGAIFALAFPPGFLYPYWTLTLHGFFWHFLLFFICLFCGFSGLSAQGNRDWMAEIPLFLACCLIALFINTVTGPQANADMFYISPYHPSVQPVFRQISLALGIFPGILVYLAAILLGSRTVHEIMKKVVHSA